MACIIMPSALSDLIKTGSYVTCGKFLTLLRLLAAWQVISSSEVFFPWFLGTGVSARVGWGMEPVSTGCSQQRLSPLAHPCPLQRLRTPSELALTSSLLGPSDGGPLHGTNLPVLLWEVRAERGPASGTGIQLALLTSSIREGPLRSGVGVPVAGGNPLFQSFPLCQCSFPC